MRVVGSFDVVRLAAWLFAALSVVVIGFHVMAIAGASVGHLTMGGRWPGVLPLPVRLLSLASLLVMALLVFVVLARARVIDVAVPRWALRAVLVYLAVAIPMHVATPAPGERKLWLPVILGLTAAALVVELRADVS